MLEIKTPLPSLMSETVLFESRKIVEKGVVPQAQDASTNENAEMHPGA
jgi:hypothetical protein